MTVTPIPEKPDASTEQLFVCTHHLPYGSALSYKSLIQKYDTLKKIKHIRLNLYMIQKVRRAFLLHKTRKCC